MALPSLSQEQLVLLLSLVLRECARLHGANESLVEAMESLKLAEKFPDVDFQKLDLHAIQMKAEQKFWEEIEHYHPGLAALIDDRNIGEVEP